MRFPWRAGDLYGSLTALTGVMQVAAMPVFVYRLWSLRKVPPQLQVSSESPPCIATATL